MPFSSDTLLERMYLKRQIIIWRLIAIAVVMFFGVQFIEYNKNISPVSGDFIARLTISGMILDDRDRDKLLKEIEEDDSVKALIVYLDTPGGTAVGGEMLYNQLHSISKKKPVVALMRTMCASAGYMIAVGADRVFAMDSTLTGSIGVIMQAAEVTELAKKIGVKPIVVKSGVNKAVPSLVEPFTPSQREIMQGVIDDYYQVFLDLVAKARGMTAEEVRRISNGGRIFSGRQALKLNLIDELGSEKEALTWLRKERNIDNSIKIKDVKVEKPRKSFFEKITGSMGFDFLNKLTESSNKHDGLLLLWKPNLI